MDTNPTFLHEIALPVPLDRVFTYRCEAEIVPGTRVEVPFGKRRMIGVVVGPGEKPEDESVVLKSIAKIVDTQPSYSPTLLKLAQWVSRYYQHPLGEVLRTMLPASISKGLAVNFRLNCDSAQLELEDEYRVSRTFLKEAFGKRKQLTQATLKKKFTESGLPETWEVWLKLALKQKWLSRDTDKTIRARKAKDETGQATLLEAKSNARTLTADQEHAMDLIRQAADSDAKQPVLLWGVTGSGKTEVYMNAIEHALIGGNDQVLIMVPEISLTPQMTHVFEQRFPNQVEVVHSGLSDAQRWARLERVRSGAAKVLIGPRSAVFAPFQALRLIIVDEEHDNSYKQTTGLTYNGRDVAVLRGRLEHATVILGSATPSLESYQNAQLGKYLLARMPNRVTGRPLPEVVLVKARPSSSKGVRIQSGSNRGSDDTPEVTVAQEILDALSKNFADGNQSMVLVNRRGYAYYLLGMQEGKAVECPNCSISLTLHKRSTLLRCHYCDYQVTVTEIQERFPNESFVAVGSGSERVEEFLRSAIPGVRVSRLDSDTASQKDVLPKTIRSFREGELDVLVGTQMLAKGHDFPNVTLICMIEVDQTLSLPDFRAGERTFQLLVQAAGRAGRAERPGKVYIQTVQPQHPVIQLAVDQDYSHFADRELSFRRAHGYPPFRKMIALEWNGTQLGQVEAHSRTMRDALKWWQENEPDTVGSLKILGPVAPPIEFLRGRHRRSLLLVGEKPEDIGRVSRSLLGVKSRNPDIRIKIDVDPQALI